MYERRQHALLPFRAFLGRLARHFFLAMGLVLLSLAIGIAGYIHFENLSPIDAFLNAAMLLGGMGPVNAPLTSGGKIFAAIYALYAGLVFLIGAGLLFAPVFHRLLHHFHWEDAKR
jgi:hypothetical protein